MTGKPFTAQQVLDTMEEIVIEAGYDHVYKRTPGPSALTGGIAPQCRYADLNDRPSCLVGQVIHKLDPEAFKLLARTERSCGGRAAPQLISGGYLPPDFWDADAALVAGLAQTQQDAGVTWGEALAYAQNFGAEAD